MLIATFLSSGISPILCTTNIYSVEHTFVILHDNCAMVGPVESSTQSIGSGLFTGAATLSVLLKWVSTPPPDPAGQYHCEQTLRVLL